MKIVGILLILNALVLTTWWVCTEHQHKAWAIPAGLLTIFVGMYFTVQDRAIEITIKNVGTIKAAAEQATVDANAIAELRRRVESQSATVNLVAESAAKAHGLIEDLSEKNEAAESKIEELETSGAAIQKTISNLEETAEFTSLVAAAQNDDRTAFNNLFSWVNKKSSPYWQHAADAVVRIRTDFGGPIERGCMKVPWPEGTDPTQLPLARLKQEYQGAIRVYKADIVQTVWKSSVIDKKDKMSFFVDVLKDDDSLTATFRAGKYFVEASSDSSLKWSPFLTKPLLDWWAEHADSINQ